MKNELESFNDLWERETAKTIKLLESLPRDGYDFRPDPEGRSASWPGIWPRSKVTEALGSSAEESRRIPARQGCTGREQSKSCDPVSNAFITMRSSA